MSEQVAKVGSIRSRIQRSVSSSKTETTHVDGKMQKIRPLEDATAQPIVGTDEKGRNVHQAMLYARGKSLVEGIDSVCIVQARTSTWGGPKWSNSKSDDVLTSFRQSSKNFDSNTNIAYRFAFVKVGDLTNTEDIVNNLKDNPLFIRNFYSNDFTDVITDEQAIWLAKPDTDEQGNITQTMEQKIEKTMEKLALKDKDGNYILDAQDSIVFRQSFAVATLINDFTSVSWKKGSKGGKGLDDAKRLLKEYLLG